MTVALLGADGAGKTTVARRLEDEADIPVKYIYMGINPEASNYALPTTRLILRMRRWLGRETHVGGPPDRRRRQQRQGHQGLQHMVKRALRGIRSTLRLVNTLAEEWFRQCVAWYHRRRGFVVLFDRHFFADYHAHDIVGAGERSFLRRIHGFLLNRFYPRPDLVILLDAPAQVLFDRKSEGTVELVEERRQEYFQLRELVANFVVVDADRPLDAVVREVGEVIRGFLDGRKSP